MLEDVYDDNTLVVVNQPNIETMLAPLKDGVKSTTPINQLSTQDGIQPLAAVLPTQDTTEANTPKEESGGHVENDEREKFLPQIELSRTGRNLNTYATDLSIQLPRNVLYNYGSDVVEIQKPKDKLETPIVSMDAVRFRTWMEKHVRNGVVVTKKVTTEVNGKPVTVEAQFFHDQTIKETDSKAVLVNDVFKESLPTVERVIDFPMPVIKDGKVVIPKPGYNEITKTYLQPTAPTIDYNMSLEVAKEIILGKILGDFPFNSRDSNQSRTHAIAWLLTPYFRGVIDALTPFWQFRANRHRAGKDYLAETSHAIYTGDVFEDAPLPEYDEKGYEKSEETRKRITTLFHQGRRFIHFANCAGYVEDKHFIAAITAPVWADRKLGSNTLLQFRNEMQFSISGNMDLTLSRTWSLVPDASHWHTLKRTRTLERSELQTFMDGSRTTGDWFYRPFTRCLEGGWMPVCRKAKRHSRHFRSGQRSSAVL